ncbi:MAG: glycoside hydrolase family 2 TIM barrel-domain containing protein, partial [Lacisediminihabitans sp.]
DPVLDARRRGMPMVQCEYAHAMGNGPGGLADYEAIFDRHPRLIGGFVWEWYDHGLAITDADGRPSFAYGGDFGERRHDGSFIVDGLLMPDRTPSPGLTELAAVFAPVRITVGEADITVLNRQAFASTAGFAFRWTLSDDGHEIAAGVLDVPPVAAQERAVVALPSLPDANGEAVLTVVAALAADSLWAGAGHPIAHAQRVSGAVAAPVGGAVDRVIVTESGYRVADAEFDAVGRLVRLGAREVVSARMDAWRPPTENDRYVSVTGEPTMESVWREDGLERLEERLLAVSVEQGAVGGAELLVRSRVAGSATDTGFDVEYRWASVNGALRLRMSVVRTGEWRTPLPRLGLTLALRQSDPGSVPVSWYGYGPGESYPDSTSAVLLGEHCGTVRELQTDYVVPQENGRRAGVRRARVGELELAGLFDLTVRPWSIDHLAAARHASELSAGDLLWLHIDVGANGVGSAACGPGVREADRLVLATAMLDICLRNVSM